MGDRRRHARPLITWCWILGSYAVWEGAMGWMCVCVLCYKARLEDKWERGADWGLRGEANPRGGWDLGSSQAIDGGGAGGGLWIRRWRRPKIGCVRTPRIAHSTSPKGAIVVSIHPATAPVTEHRKPRSLARLASTHFGTNWSPASQRRTRRNGGDLCVT